MPSLPSPGNRRSPAQPPPVITFSSPSSNRFITSPSSLQLEFQSPPALPFVSHLLVLRPTASAPPISVIPHRRPSPLFPSQICLHPKLNADSTPIVHYSGIPTSVQIISPIPQPRPSNPAAASSSSFNSPTTFPSSQQPNCHLRLRPRSIVDATIFSSPALPFSNQSSFLPRSQPLLTIELHLQIQPAPPPIPLSSAVGIPSRSSSTPTIRTSSTRSAANRSRSGPLARFPPNVGLPLSRPDIFPILLKLQPSQVDHPLKVDASSYCL